MKAPSINGNVYSKLDDDVKLEKQYIEAINQLAKKYYMPNISTLNSNSTEKQIKDALAKDLRQVEKEFKKELESCQGFIKHEALRVNHKIPHLEVKDILVYANSKEGFYYDWSDSINDGIDKDLVLNLLLQGHIIAQVGSPHYYTLTLPGKRLLEDLIESGK